MVLLLLPLLSPAEAISFAAGGAPEEVDDASPSRHRTVLTMGLALGPPPTLREAEARFTREFRPP